MCMHVFLYIREQIKQLAVIVKMARSEMLVFACVKSTSIQTCVFKRVENNLGEVQSEFILFGLYDEASS